MREGPLDTTTSIETPEHVQFEYRVAGPARRMFAHLLDLCICYGAVIFLGFVLIVAASSIGELTSQMQDASSATMGIVLVLLFLAQWVYFAFFEAWKGRSLGKMALSLRVVTTTGRPIGVRAAALRNLLRAADFLPFGYATGVVSQIATPRFQRLGDLVAETMVIIEEGRAVGRPIVLHPPARAEELEGLPFTVRLNPDEKSALELFLRRRAQFGTDRERELATMVAPMFAQRFGVQYTDPVRFLALIYDRATNTGREDSPVSSRGGSLWPSSAS